MDVLSAPCVFCGYNGEGYWQPGRHRASCPWREVGGNYHRLSLLRDVLAVLVARQPPADPSPPASPGAGALPKRSHAELASDLRVRADYLSGQSWEVPATAAMMREAADALEAAASREQALIALVEEMRSIALVAGQCSVDGDPNTTKALMAAAEAERASRWADHLDALIRRSPPHEKG